MLLTMSSFIFPIITFPYVSRILLPEGTGRVSFAISLITYFTMFAQLGIPTYGIRACAVVRDDKEKLTKTAHELLIINLVMSVLSYAVFIVMLLFVPRLQDDRTLYLIVSVNIFLTAIGMEWIYKAMEMYSYITIRSIIFKFVALCAMFLLVHEQKDYVIYGGISIFAASASNILNFINIHKYIDFKPRKNYDFKRHFKAIGVFFAMSCAATVYLHLDTIMLKFMVTDTEVGYYNAATKIKSILVSVVTSLGTVLLPRVSYYVKNGMMDKFDQTTQKALNFVFLLSVPVTVYFTIFAREGVYFLSGEAYEGAIIPMQIIMPTVICIGITNLMGVQILIPLGMERYVLYSEIAGAIVDLILNIFLIPRCGSSGASIGTLAAEIVVLIFQAYVLRDRIKNAFLNIKYYKLLIANGIAVLCSIWVLLLAPKLHFKTELNCFIILLISAALYFSVYLLCLIILKENLVREIIEQAINKIRRKA